jgi:hypothetical protein
VCSNLFRAVFTSYTLPFYKAAPPATAWRLSLTPVAVAVDGAIVLVVASAAARPAMQ